ncbi:poly(rC)-binding protein 3 isoform X3 [Bemisia tabaci]|uniref:poly(rC)-binding protein 3 isoform X3 n=1 Tax=Bemisia tabaci TaxID=7038 RepID=UPI0008F9AAD7|nr:PREDICTED: poly(rC)-binding protein 3 isoform X3 [Bemisia tabaci]
MDNMNSSEPSLDKINLDKINNDPGITLTIRLIMQSKEVGSIIGKGGEIVKRFREESGAKINISDGSCSERIVTVSGTTSAIYKAFLLICKKFEDYCYQFQENGSGGSRPPITLRLIVPASQCGSLIGRGGCKIKEIREECRASIQVASDMLPNSTERAVTVTGTGEAITQCIYHICVVMLECPPKGVTIPYRPKPQVSGPVILAGGQAYTIQGNYAVPAHGGDVSSAPPALTGLLGPPGPPILANALMDPLTKNAHLQAALPPTNILPPTAAYEIGKLGGGPLAGLAALGLGGLGAPTNATGINPAAALAAIAGSQLRNAANPPANNRITQQNQNSHQTHELTVPNDLIGCIIGKGGSKIAEIRQISGAMIRISNCEEREGGSTDRTISISGNPDAVALAQYLINMRISMETAGMPIPAYHYITPNHIVKTPIH